MDTESHNYLLTSVEKEVTSGASCRSYVVKKSHKDTVNSVMETQNHYSHLMKHFTERLSLLKI